jgi:hypothetical protein
VVLAAAPRAIPHVCPDATLWPCSLRLAGNCAGSCDMSLSGVDVGAYYSCYLLPNHHAPQRQEEYPPLPAVINVCTPLRVDDPLYLAAVQHVCQL